MKKSRKKLTTTTILLTLITITAVAPLVKALLGFL